MRKEMEDAAGTELARIQVIGIDIEHAATRLDLGKLLLTGFPGEIQRESA